MEVNEQRADFLLGFEGLGDKNGGGEGGPIERLVVNVDSFESWK